MNLDPSHDKIDRAMQSIPIEQRYNWQEVAEQLKELGFNKGDWNWWVVRHSKPEGDVK